MNLERKTCGNCKRDFSVEPEDFDFYEKIKVPATTFCPSCRDQRRLAFRNDRSLYTRTCGLCGKRLITLYSSESRITPYCNKCYWSDAWDAKSYARDYDFGQLFFEQYKSLQRVVPHQATVNDNEIMSSNCEYSHDCWFARNCYMTFYVWKVENLFYCCYIVGGGKNLVDCLYVLDQGEWMYDCVLCDKSYTLLYSELCVSCSDSCFLYDCRNCSNCVMCVGLRNKQYCVKNRQYSKEEYESILKSYELNKYSGCERARKEFDKFILFFPRRYARIFQSVNCTGDHISNGKDSKWCFLLKNSIGCKWMDAGDTPTDCYDLSTSGELSQCYEVVTCDQSNMNRFGLFSVKSQDLQYTQYCTDSKHLFGCVGLRKAEFCILNKQYSKEDYESLVQRIKRHMEEMPYVDSRGVCYRYGEYFPAGLSPFGYNETVAAERYPLMKEEAITNGFLWQDKLQVTFGKETKNLVDVPDAIQDVDVAILDEVLACTRCSRNYKLVRGELDFYKSLKIPIPRKCFFCRHADRIRKSNPFRLWRRQCMCDYKVHVNSVKHINHPEGRCSNEFETSYALDRPEVVYCEQCYQSEIN